MSSETQTRHYENTEYIPTIKQQIKLMEVLSSGDIANFNKTVEESNENHDLLLDQLVNKYPLGEINQNDIKSFLLNVDPPMSQANHSKHETNRGILFDNFSQNSETMNLVEYLSRGLLDKSVPVSELELENILNKYPTPNEARSKIEEFMDEHLYKYNDDIIDNYNAKAEKFLKSFYGKRYEYSICFDEIQKKITSERQHLGYVQKLSPNTNQSINYNYEQVEQSQNNNKSARKFGKSILDRLISR